MRAKEFVVNRCIRVSIVVFRVLIVVFRVSFVTFYRVSFVTTPCFNRSQAVVKGLISNFKAFRLLNLEVFEALLLIKKLLIEKLSVCY